MKNETKKTAGVGPSMDELLTRMNRLEAESAAKDQALDESSKKILALEAAAEAAGTEQLTSYGRQVQERFIGKRKVEGLKYDHKKKEYMPHEFEVDMFEYLVDLAPNQGTEIKINSKPYQHNEIIEVDANTLRTLKEMIARGWVHESQVNGSQESKFRSPQQRPALSMKGMS